MGAFAFVVEASDGVARSGVLSTPRGGIETPAFMPVGTAGTVKALTMEQVRQAGAQVVLGNTYHLMLRPTAERVARLGGLQRGAMGGPHGNIGLPLHIIPPLRSQFADAGDEDGGLAVEGGAIG